MKRSRAAILPYPGDPFLLNYWLEIFYKFWEPEVDKLYIVLNSPIEDSVVEHIKYLCNDEGKKINFTYIPRQMEHGDVLKIALEAATEKYVMLIEDDAFIFKSGVVNYCFELLESGQYDIVGSKRGSCSAEILEAAKNRWGLNYSGHGDQGCNFWPCYFFSERQLLLNTDRHFSARAWTIGETVSSLGYVVEVPVIAGDTFVNTSLQLQNIVPQTRIKYLPQNHGSPEDLQHYERRSDLFDGTAWWTHIGSLSSGVGGILMDGNNRSLARRKKDPEGAETVLNKQWCQTTQEHHEFERRVHWWLTFWEKRVPGELKEFAQLYRIAIDRVITQYDLDINLIRQGQRIYRTLGL